MKPVSSNVPSGSSNETAGLLARIDHLVYGTPDLELGIRRLEGLLGIRAAPGGQHPQWGTRNALISLGTATYLEIIGPDPDQPESGKARPFGLDNLKEPRLVTWAAKGKDLEQWAGQAASRGVRLGAVRSGSRKRMDGLVLSWRLTDPETVLADGLVPFFIDWGTTPHPAQTAAQGATLTNLRGEHPDPERVRALLLQLDLALPVRSGAEPALIAELSSPRGKIELR